MRDESVRPNRHAPALCFRGTQQKRSSVPKTATGAFRETKREQIACLSEIKERTIATAETSCLSLIAMRFYAFLFWMGRLLL